MIEPSPLQTTLESRRSEHLVETDWLADRISAADAQLRIVDMRGFVRTKLVSDGVQTADYVGALDDYNTGHIPGAIYLDWTSDIVDDKDPVVAQVAPPDKMKRVLEAAGIGNDTLVVAYDSHPASQFATRLWWALRYYGHQQARVLNGGWTKWLREGRPVSTAVPDFPPVQFVPNTQAVWRATAEQVMAEIENPDVLLLDARDEEQYRGQIRRGSRGGHIPGAKHLPRELFFTPEGVFRTEEELQSIVQEKSVDPKRRVIAYCNGGVAATSVLFTLSMLGYRSLTNYDGSWNEWAEREDLPIEK